MNQQKLEHYFRRVQHMVRARPSATTSGPRPHARPAQPGRILCEHCIGHKIGANVGVTLLRLIRSALCWHTESEEVSKPFVSKASGCGAGPARLPCASRPLGGLFFRHPPVCSQIARKIRRVQKTDLPIDFSSSAPTGPAGPAPAQQVPAPAGEQQRHQHQHQHDEARILE